MSSKKLKKTIKKLSTSESDSPKVRIRNRTPKKPSTSDTSPVRAKSETQKKKSTKKKVQNSSEKEKEKINTKNIPLDEKHDQFGITIISLEEFLFDSPHKTHPIKDKYTLSESPTEKEIYELAVKAYKTGNVVNFSELKVKKKLSDKFSREFIISLNHMYPYIVENFSLH